MKENLKNLAALFLAVFVLAGNITVENCTDIFAATHTLAINALPKENVVSEGTLMNSDYSFSLGAYENTKIEFMNWETNKPYTGKIFKTDQGNNYCTAIYPMDDRLGDGRLGAWIYNCGKYHGKSVDVKMTFYWKAVSVNGTKEYPLIGFWLWGKKSQHHINTLLGSRAYEIKYELYSNGKRINVNMSLTLGDIDMNQWYGFKNNDGDINKILCLNKCKTYYKPTGTNNKFNWFYADEYESNDGPEATVRIELKGAGSFNVVYGPYYDIRQTYTYFERIPQSGTSIDTLEKRGVKKAKELTDYANSGTEDAAEFPKSGWAYFDAKSYGPYDVPKPIKAFGKIVGESDGRDNKIEYSDLFKFEGDAYSYGITQFVPLQTKDYYYKSFVIKDTLPESDICHDEYISAKVIDSGDVNQNDKFTIAYDKSTRTVTATAKSNVLKSSDFYNNTYTLVIEVKLVQDTLKQKEYELNNKALVTITDYKSTSKETHTNTVKSTYHQKPLRVYKKWEDNDNQDRIRPESIHVDLIRKTYDPNKRQPISISKVTEVSLSDKNNWQDEVFEHDDNYPLDNVLTPFRYVYEWTEKYVAGYTASYENSGDNTTVTNMHIPLIELPHTGSNKGFYIMGISLLMILSAVYIIFRKFKKHQK